MEECAWSDGSKPERSTKQARFVKSSTKREDANEKLSARQLIGQNAMNPFFVNRNFEEDMRVQESFLKTTSGS